MKNSISTAFLVTCSLLSGAACSSAYTPRPGPRVSVIQEGGAPKLVKNGRTYEFGFFGGGLAEAVSGNPTAERYAESFQNRSKTAFGLNVGGIVLTTAGLSTLLVGTLNRSIENESVGILSGSMVLTGLSLMLAGAFVAISAPPALWDAINSYNDAVLPYPSIPVVPGWYAPTPPPMVPGGAPALPPPPSAPPQPSEKAKDANEK